MMTSVIWAIEHVLLILSFSFTNYLFLVSYLFSNDITFLQCYAPGPSLYPIHALCHCCEPLLAGWQQVPGPRQQQQQQPGTTANAMSPHHQLAYEPLLVGGNGGADDDDYYGCLIM